MTLRGQLITLDEWVCVGNDHLTTGQREMRGETERKVDIGAREDNGGRRED